MSNILHESLPKLNKNIDGNDDTSDYYLFSSFFRFFYKYIDIKEGNVFCMNSHDCDCQFKDQLNDYNKIDVWKRWGIISDIIKLARRISRICEDSIKHVHGVILDCLFDFI